MGSINTAPVNILGEPIIVGFDVVVVVLSFTIDTSDF